MAHPRAPVRNRSVGVDSTRKEATAGPQYTRTENTKCIRQRGLLNPRLGYVSLPSTIRHLSLTFPTGGSGKVNPPYVSLHPSNSKFTRGPEGCGQNDTAECKVHVIQR